MKNKKVIISILVIIAIIVLGIILLVPKKASSDSFTLTRNFYVDEYEEEYSKYENEFNVGKDVEKIYIDGATKQGNIDITLIDTNNNEHKITITNQVQTEIEVDGQYGKWKYIINIYPDTDGSVTISDSVINHENLVKTNNFYK